MFAVLHPLKGDHFHGNNGGAGFVQAFEGRVTIIVMARAGGVLDHPHAETSRQKRKGGLQQAHMGFTATDNDLLAIIGDDLQQAAATGVKVDLGDRLIGEGGYFIGIVAQLSGICSVTITGTSMSRAI